MPSVLLLADLIQPASSLRRSVWLALAVLTPTQSWEFLSRARCKRWSSTFQRSGGQKLLRTLRQLLEERLRASGIPDGDAPEVARLMSRSSSRRTPCSDDLVISEQRLDFLASLPRIGGKTCLLMEDDAHLRVIATSFGETFRQEP